MNEPALIQAKAARMDLQEVIAEISRIEAAMAAGAARHILERYSVRRRIFADRLDTLLAEREAGAMCSFAPLLFLGAGFGYDGLGYAALTLAVAWLLSWLLGPHPLIRRRRRSTNPRRLPK